MAADGDAMPFHLGDHALAGDRLEARRLAQPDALARSMSAHRLGQRMFGIALCRGRQAQRLGWLDAVEGDHALNLGASKRQRAGFVEQQHVGARQRLDVFAAFDQHALACSAPDRRQHGDRRGQRNRARAGDDQHRRHCQRVAANQKGERSDGDYDGQVIAAEAVGEALHFRAVAFRLLHQPDHATKGGVGADALGADAQAAQAGDGGGEDAAARLRLHRQRLSGDGRLIHRGVAFDDDAIHRNLLAGTHDDNFAGPHRLHRNLLLDAVAHDARLFGRQRRQIAQRSAGAFCSESLDIVADAHEKDHHRRRRPFADRQRREHAQGHQRVRGDLSPARRTCNIGEDRPSAQHDQRCADCERHARRDLLKQSQPLADHHHEEHGAEHQRQHRPHLARIPCVRFRRRLLRRLRHGVARFRHRRAQLLDRRHRRVHLQDRLFGGQEDLNRRHARRLRQCVLHMSHTLGAIHAAHRQFKRLQRVCFRLRFGGCTHKALTFQPPFII